MRVNFLADVPGGALGGVGRARASRCWSCTAARVCRTTTSTSWPRTSATATASRRSSSAGSRRRCSTGRSTARVRSTTWSPCSTRSAGRGRGCSGTRGAGICCCTSRCRLRGGSAAALRSIRSAGSATAARPTSRRSSRGGRRPRRRRGRSELDQRALRGEATEEEMDESLRLVWPAYFASPDHTLPYDSPAASQAAYSGLADSLKAELPRLEAALPSVRVPFGVLAGGRSPMPRAAAPPPRRRRSRARGSTSSRTPGTSPTSSGRAASEPGSTG